LKSQDHESGNELEVSTKLTGLPAAGLVGLKVKLAVGALGDWVKLPKTVAFAVIVKIVDREELFENVPPLPDHFPKTQPEAGEANSTIAVPDEYPWVQFLAPGATAPPELGFGETDSV
jgi:hypothetical protein